MKKNIGFILASLFLFSGHLFAQFDTTAYQAFSRLDYYTNEEEGQIAVFVPEDKKGVDVSIDLAFEYQFLERGFEIHNTGITLVPFELERLENGDNEITVSFNENGSWREARKVNVVKLDYKAHQVQIDRASGGLVVNGLPFIPFGFYTESPVWKYLPENEVVKGFNLMSPYQEINRKGLKERKEYMDRCASLGMMVNYNICNLANANDTADAQGTREQKMEMLKKEVETFRDHPALLSWYISDEPVGQGVKPGDLKEAYDLIKKLDPYHPVSIVFMSPEKASAYKDVMDIAMTDPYPVPDHSVADAATYTKSLYSQFRYEKPVWIVPQAFGGNEWWMREPTASEERVMTYLGIIQHATGVQYFIRNPLNGSPKSLAAWGECGAVAMEIAELSPELCSGQQAPQIISSDQKVQAAAWYRDGIITILAASTAPGPLPFSLRIDGYDLTGEVPVMFEGRSASIRDGNIFDIIDGYGTRAYRIDMRHKVESSDAISRYNMSVDPGFEENSGPGIPAACYVKPGQDKGSTFFLDSRISFEGDHSLRLNTPEEGKGALVNFYGLKLSPESSYSISIMAKAGPTSNVPGKAGFFKRLFGTNNKGPLVFGMSLGIDNRQNFELSDKWELYTLRAADISGEINSGNKVIPALELIGKGTAWFDLMQVIPDIQVSYIAVPGKDKVQVQISSVYPGADIYYTTDGSEPTTTSEKYIGPVQIGRITTLRAAAYEEGQKVGFLQKDFGKTK